MNLWDGVKKALVKIAPIAASAVIPGSGGLVGSLISSVLGVENEPQAIETALKGATPDQIAAIKSIENQHQERLIELATENDKLYIHDRQDARSREARIVESTGKKDINLYALAWTVIICFFLLVGFLMFVDLPDKNIGPVNQLFGAMATGFGMVLAYFFGSSKSSSDKSKLLANRK